MDRHDDVTIYLNFGKCLGGNLFLMCVLWLTIEVSDDNIDKMMMMTMMMMVMRELVPRKCIKQKWVVLMGI